MSEACMRIYKAKDNHNGYGYYHKIENELSYFRKIRSFKDAVKFAAHPVDQYTKKSIYDHQDHIVNRKMRDAAKCLTTRRSLAKLRACANFDAILDHVTLKTAHIRGLDELYFYDVALRIGAKRGKYPDKVYLHRGTKDGAENLGLKDKFKVRKIRPPRNFTLRFKKSKLTLKYIDDKTLFSSSVQSLEFFHIECFLCVFANDSI